MQEKTRMEMSKRFVLTVSLVFLLSAAVGPLVAQPTEENYIRELEEASAVSTLSPKAAIGPVAGFINPPELDPQTSWKEMWICRAGGPAEIQGYQVQCTGATFLDFHVADCCIPGDHWQLKGKNWDRAPNTGVTTAPDRVNTWSVPGRAYNYGGTASSPGSIRAYVECTYPHGVDVFLADSFVHFSSDGTCSVTPDTMRRRIDRAP